MTDDKTGQTLTDSSDFVFVYTTLPDMDTAQAMARMLVKEKLAACANLYPGLRSIYEWQGRIHNDEEVGAFIKTRAILAPALVARARACHPYDTPAFLVLPLAGGAEDYLAWVRAQTASGPGAD